MLYGDTVHDGSIYWLTHGAAQIPAWRNTLAMALAFPGIILYGVAFFALEDGDTDYFINGTAGMLQHCGQHVCGAYSGFRQYNQYG